MTNAQTEVAIEPVVLTPTLNDLKSLVGINVTNALNRFNGKEDRYRHWLADFIATADQIPDNIRHEIANDQLDLAARLVHSFKGRVGMLGMMDLHAEVSALEQLLNDGTATGDLLNKLEHSITLMRDQLIKVLSTQNFPTSPTMPASETMAPERITWSEIFSVGVPQMDTQHKKLIDIINQLADCLRNDLNSPSAAQTLESKSTFHEVLSEMFNYTQLHFTAEEVYLQRIGYPKIEAHENQHASFIENLAELSMAASEGRLDTSGVHQYLKDWLFGHILKSDMQYRQFIETSHVV